MPICCRTSSWTAEGKSEQTTDDRRQTTDDSVLAGGVQDQSYDLADLCERDRADVPDHFVDPISGYRTDVLALGGRSRREAVPFIGFEDDLRAETANRGGQRDNVDDARSRVDNPLSGHNDRRSPEAGLVPGRNA